MSSNGTGLTDKVALITGAASGIGKGIAEKLAAAGVKLVVTDIDKAGLQKLSNAYGDRCVLCHVDVTVEADLERATAMAVEHFGRLDIAVNAAGVGGFARIVDQTEAQWDHIVDISMKGTFLSMKHEGRQMKACGNGGVIINIASLNAQQPAAGMSAYAAAKAGVEMLTRIGGMEMARHHVRVCAISPGLIATPATQDVFATPALYGGYMDNILLGRSGTVDDIANAALFLVSDAASWITGTTMLVDGGAANNRYPDFTKLPRTQQ
ncbi:MAG: SDR family oxidoreductase [Sulfuricaulis sp.]|nr:SDR family oxidoreductase [Sulfuricaulis sp.]